MSKHPRLTMDEFCAVARQVLEELPEPFPQWLENTVVDVELEPSPKLMQQMGLDRDEDELLGLFQGLAISEQEYDTHAPNRIWLFKHPIERRCRSCEEIRYEIRRTVIHELAHHFGYSEDDLEEFESRPSPFDESAD